MYVLNCVKICTQVKCTIFFVNNETVQVNLLEV
jgi:hypothetical protein